MELPPILFMNLRQITLTKLKRFDLIFYAFGVAIMLNSLTTAVLLHKLFGDSTTPKNAPTSLPSIQRSVEQ